MGVGVALGVDAADVGLVVDGGLDDPPGAALPWHPLRTTLNAAMTETISKR